MSVHLSPPPARAIALPERISARWSISIRPAALVLLAALVGVPVLAASRGSRTGVVGVALAQQEPTPIIEPLPKPEPIYLPLTVRVYKASAPDPLDSERMGYLTGMSAAGRQACQPGAYALLDKPEGRPDAKALAVLYSAAHGPNLDFFVGEAVKVKGALLQSPTQCRIFTVWLMEVERIERIELPPLH